MNLQLMLLKKEGEEEIDLDELIRELDAISEAGKDEKEMEEGKKRGRYGRSC